MNGTSTVKKETGRTPPWHAALEGTKGLGAGGEGGTPEEGEGGGVRQEVEGGGDGFGAEEVSVAKYAVAAGLVRCSRK